jgi:putative FmdB family regulatory protein
MPTYEYECTRCGHVFEKFQSISAPPAKRCPKCRGKVNKLLSAGAGILFKGSGFYTTDYRSDSYKKAAKSESETASKPKSKEKKDGDTKKKKPSTKSDT